MKTSDLIGPALDWAVAKCEGWPERGFQSLDGIQRNTVEAASHPFSPSTDWSQGGPIIEREKIGTWPSEKEGREDQWGARMLNTYITYGPTLLVAAMRAYVSSKLGDEVEIPEELK